MDPKLEDLVLTNDIHILEYLEIISSYNHMCTEICKPKTLVSDDYALTAQCQPINALKTVASTCLS